jgi:hypothetical protein
LTPPDAGGSIKAMFSAAFDTTMTGTGRMSARAEQATTYGTRAAWSRIRGFVSPIVLVHRTKSNGPRGRGGTH